MGSLSSIVSRVTGGGRAAARGRRGTSGGLGQTRGRASGRRTQDEAIGRGVRSLLRRAR